MLYPDAVVFAKAPQKRKSGPEPPFPSAIPLAELDQAGHSHQNANALTTP
jgi:hypothetical protein